MLTSNGFIDFDGSGKLGMGCNSGKKYEKYIILFELAIHEDKLEADNLDFNSTTKLLC